MLRLIAQVLRPDGVLLLIGTVGARHGYHSWNDWLALLEPQFQIIKTTVVSPVLPGQRFFNHPWFPAKQPVYGTAMLLARMFPRRLSRHVGWLCRPKAR